MMKAAIAGALALLCLSATNAWAADATGLWRTQTAGEVEIYHCGAALCGKLVNSPRLRADPALKDFRNKDAALRGRSLKGMVMIQGLHGGPTSWSDGQLYNPEDGNTYSGALTLLPNGQVQLKGCALMVLCKTQVWNRIR